MTDFDQIIGNTALKAHLQRTLQEDKLSHAYLITGQEGSGKKMLAMAFAKALRCTGVGEKPCMVCGNCQDFLKGKFHPDILFLRPGKNSKGEDKRSIGVDEVREQVVGPVSIRPDGASKKVFVLEDAHLLTVQAQNALLKSLEEPPAYAVFVLLAERADALLPTILSRLVHLQTESLSAGTIASQLENRLGLSSADAQTIASYARGSLGRALMLSESSDFARMKADVEGWIAALQSQTTDILSAMALAEEMKAYSKKPEFLELFTLYYRDILVALVTEDPALLLEKAKTEQIIEEAQTETAAQLLKRLDAVEVAARQLAQNGNFTLTMEAMLRKLKESYT